MWDLVAVAFFCCLVGFACSYLLTGEAERIVNNFKVRRGNKGEETHEG
jgi:hypothetical protein